MHTISIFSTKRGFTLIEMAIVLVVLGLTASLLIAPLAMRFEASQRHAAESMLDDITEALIGFALVQGRLPCPSIEPDPFNPAYGLEQGPPCSLNVPGYLPWRTLGLPGHDPWGNPRTGANQPWVGCWRYQPDKNFVEGTISLSTLPSGQIQIKDHDGNLVSTSDSRVVAVVFSTGPNRHADGLNAAYSPASPSFEAGEPTPAFDDLVRWVGHPLFIARLARSGRL
ncbi:MAG: prepilin-type N-terminal cleavage/methylation domain-containing protein [Betaproteobacteria bacterium]|nr:prepilin-type N-terminal cleavage/methylation domain-containing protein [Betaproteobacteria bacterium]